MNINNILEDECIFDYLEKRNLLNQYKKAKNFVLSWINTKSFFKEKQPKWSWIWYFRINKQYRAIWSFDKYWNLLIYKIDNHS